MDNKELYKSKVIAAQDVLGLIKENDSIVTTYGCCEPLEIERVILENYKQFKNVRVTNMLLIKGTPWAEEKYKGHFHYNSFFASASSREAINSGYADFTTCNFHEIPQTIKEVVKPRVTIVSVCPPDEDGFVSLGTNCDYIATTLEYCEVKIAQVNKFVPRTYGATRRHISEFDYFVEHDEELPELPPSLPTELERAIGKNCASLINDGDCIQLGIGGIPNAICTELCHKKNLGLHSEMVSDGIIDLLNSGAVDNSRKQTHIGKSVISFVFGTKKLFDFLDNNKDIEFYPISYVNHPMEIAKNDNMISINSCIEIDLLGQVVSDTIGKAQFSGVGGQVDFVRGATMSRGGKSIMAMPSSAKGGTVSKIVPLISEGSAVTTPRNDVNYVVTEYGIAQLKGLTNKERARALIKIAHPNFREMLCKAFEERYNEKAF